MNKAILCWCLLVLVACEKPTQSTENIAVSWTVIENLGDRYECQWELKNTGKSSWGDEGWTLYYNQVAGVPVPESLPDEVVVTQVTGTFYSIKPAPGFTLGPDESLTFNYQCWGAAIKITDAPAGLYMIFDDQEEAQLVDNYSVGAFEDPKQINRNPQDLVPIPTAKVRYQMNEKLSLIEDAALQPIIPTPWQYQSGNKSYELGSEISISFPASIEQTAQILSEKLRQLGQLVTLEADKEEADIKLVLSTAAGLDSEGYLLVVDENGVTITGSTPAGIFYGGQSLLALWPAKWEPQLLKGVEINDKPRFPYRGMHLDVSRNFHRPPAVKKLMDLMAYYKLNKFHFHLTDDEGWRLAIKGLPELTSVGATRGHTLDEREFLSPAYGSGPFPYAENNYGTGYYTREDFIEIIQYAHARNIEVIPEINFPGHARAAIKAMEARERRIQESSSDEPSLLLSDPLDSSIYKSVQGYDDNVICVCKESVYQFIEHVISDIVSMYQEAEVPLNIVHTGGDEVPAGIWEKSPDCAALLEASPDLEDPSDLPNYFLHRYHEILQQHDLVTAGWEEIAMHRVEAEVGGEDDPLSSRSIMVPNPEFKDANFLAYVWLSIWGVAGEDLAYKLANMGYKVVMSNASNLYFDFAYDKDPLEPGFYWAGLVGTRQPFELTPLNILKTGTNDIMGHPLSMDNYEDFEELTDVGRANILGIQGQLWSETVQGQEEMEYYIFPKLLALSERAWAADPPWANYTKRSERLAGLDQAWNVFANTLAQKDLPRLDRLWDSVNYRLPPPGILLENGQLKANSALPGLDIFYTLDGTEPTPNTQKYQGPVSVEAGTMVKVKTFTKTGRGSRTTTLLME